METPAELPVIIVRFTTVLVEVGPGPLRKKVGVLPSCQENCSNNSRVLPFKLVSLVPEYTNAVIKTL